MIKGLKIFCAAALFSLVSVQYAAAAEEPAKVTNTLTADDIRYNTETGDARAIGHVVVKRSDGSVLKGNEAEGNTNKQVMTIKGNVDGFFPEQNTTLKSDSAKWTGDPTDETDGTVEAFGKVHLTRKPNDKLDADYVMWKLGTRTYHARGKVNGIFQKRILDADEARRDEDKFWAKNVRRYEDQVKKYVLSAETVSGTFTEGDGGEGEEELLNTLNANKNVVFDFVDKEGLKTRVTGDNAVYTKESAVVVMSGNAKAVRSDGKTVDADKLIVHEDTHLVEAKGNSKLVFIVNEKDKKKDPAAKGAQKPAAGTAAKKDNKPADSGAKKNSAPAGTKDGGVKQSTDGKKSSLSEADENWVKNQ